MGLLGKIAAGVGDWMVHEATQSEELQMEKLKADILYNREVALEGVKHQDSMQENAQQNAAADERIDRTAGAQQQTDLVQGVVQSRIHAQDQGAETERAVQLKGLDLSNDKQLEAFKHTNKLSEIQVQSAADLQKDATLAGQTIDRVVFTKSGQMAAVYKDGSVHTKGPPGAYNPSGDNSGDSLGDIINNIRSQPAKPAASTAPQPSYSSQSANPGSFNPADTAPPAPAKPSGSSGQALVQLSKVYAMAKQNPDAYRAQYPGLFDSSGNLLPMDQAVSQVKQAYGG